MQGTQCICITGVTPWRKRRSLSQRNKTILRVLFRCDYVYRFQKTTPSMEWYFAAASSEQHLLMSSKPSLSLRHSHQQDTLIAPPSRWKLRLEICTEGFCRRKQPKSVESGALYARTIENVISSHLASDKNKLAPSSTWWPWRSATKLPPHILSEVTRRKGCAGQHCCTCADPSCHLTPTCVGSRDYKSLGRLMNW